MLPVRVGSREPNNLIHYIMKKLTNVKKLGLAPCETYYNLDGFIFQEVKHTEVLDLMNMNKEVFRLQDDESESLVQYSDNIKDTDTYGIEVGFLEDLESSVWESAYDNTSSKKIIISYKKICRHCGDETEYTPTEERQQVGNAIQRIVRCNECNNHFVEQWGFNQ